MEPTKELHWKIQVELFALAVAAPKLSSQVFAETCGLHSNNTKPGILRALSSSYSAMTCPQALLNQSGL